MEHGERTQIASEIVQNARHIADAIRTAVEDPEGLSRPLFVLFGSTHHDALHVLTQILVLKELERLKLPVAVGQEQPYNLMEQSSVSNRHKAIMVPSPFNPLDTQPDLALYDSIRMRRESPIANSLLSFTIYESGMPVIYTDAPRKAQTSGSLGYELNLCAQDSAMFRNLYYPSLEEIDSRSPQGVHIRNIVMAQNALSYVNIRKPHVYIQFCGAIHLTGTTQELGNDLYYPSDLSLGKELTGLNQRVLEVVFEGPSDILLPELRHTPGNAKISAAFSRATYFNETSMKQETSWLQQMLPLIGISISLADYNKRIIPELKATFYHGPAKIEPKSPSL